MYLGTYTKEEMNNIKGIYQMSILPLRCKILTNLLLLKAEWYLIAITLSLVISILLMYMYYV